MNFGNNIAFRDVLFTLILILVVCLGLLLLIVNKTAEPTEISTKGEIVYEISWNDDLEDDVDLWIFTPRDGRSIGYSNKNGIVTDLLRDDLGKSSDTMNVNYEIAFTRTMHEGKHVVNVHMYSKKQEDPVKVSWRVFKFSNGSKSVIASGITTLDTNGQETTLVRFWVSKTGGIVRKDSEFEEVRSRING